MHNPLLSICIPTYNRANYLEDTLKSIICQRRFHETNEVEIVISDNCSDDNTKQISEKYIEIYGDKIRYFRNSENIKDSNFEKVLSYAKGVFLKLNNDTLLHHKDTLNKIIELINENIHNKDILFFSNGEIKNVNKFYCIDLNSFIKKASYWSTWIGSFGIWKEDFESLKNFNRYSHLQLTQTDVLFRLISKNKSVIIDNKKIFDSVTPTLKGGYNIYKVFITNYLSLIEEHSVNNYISYFTKFNEKSKLLIRFLIPWTVTFITNEVQYTFDKKGAISIVFKKYKYHPILYIGILYLLLIIIFKKIKK